ncbi:hypothetical protein HPB47_008460 [Ixodes persulcatus]|uniref:Uncharacterized protein n=1 Tax=Ixodes persulcatus TaxID=34615 RepID=A0AC60P4S1_IXOPE|nr:hypothetical protein HPB47_008460 [Ixodes persulcatus]
MLENDEKLKNNQHKSYLQGSPTATSPMAASPTTSSEIWSLQAEEALDDPEAGPSIPASPADMPPPAPKKGHIQWFARDFSPGAQDCTYQMKGGSTPLEPPEYFMRYFSESVFEQLAEFTNIYSLRTSGKELGTTPQELKVFFGILMAMEALKYLRIRMYWQAGTRIPMVADSMAVNRFFKIRSALHITDSNSQTDPKNCDKSWKVRPILEAVRLRCLQVEPAEENSIDEQMVAFTGRVVAKQFVRNKPNPEGVKVFVRCSKDGVAHDFEFYQGKGTGVDPKYAHLGLGGSVVMRLVESLLKGQNLSCYFDNYFTSVRLLQELKTVEILGTGTIRSNRLLGCTLKSEKEMRKEERGTIDSKISEDGDVVIVRWQDNGIVNMASTRVRVGEKGTVKRWSEAKKEHIEIECPEVVLEYNKFMGGVDKLDFIMSLYPIRTRPKKWTVRVISHFITFGLSNSWLEYIRDASEEGLPKKATKDMLTFQVDVAQSLISSNKAPQKKRGRPSLETTQPSKKPHNAEALPTNTVRYDAQSHWPEHVRASFAHRCRREGCKRKSRIRCRKCNVFLCLTVENNCFLEFHTK